MMNNENHNALEQARRILFARATARVISEMPPDARQEYDALVSRKPPLSAQELGEKIKALVLPAVLDRIWQEEQEALTKEVQMELSTKGS